MSILDVPIRSSSLPIYVGSRNQPFDTPASAYGSSARRQSVRAKLAAAASGSLVNWAACGDSKTAGYIAGTDKAWPVQARALFINAGIPIAGTGLVPVANATSGGQADPRWSSTGTWADSALYSHSTSTSATKTFTSDLAGTIAEVYYFGTSGAFTITVDGNIPSNGSVTVTNGSYSSGTVTPTGGAVGAKAAVTGLTNTTHTIVITESTASGYLIGACVRGTSGLLLHNLGIVGALSATWTTNTFAQPTGIAALAGADIISFELGTNDITTSVPVNTYKSNLQTALGTNFSSAARILIGSCPAGTSNIPTWQTFLSSLYDLGDQYAIPVVDMTDRWGTPSNANTLGLLGSDTKHETAAGHFDKARTILRTLI